MTITITQQITPENHYLLFLAAEAQRKSEDEIICVGDSIVFDGYMGEIYLPNNLSIDGNLCLNYCSLLTKLPRGLKIQYDLFLVGCRRLYELPDDLNVDISRTASHDALGIGFIVVDTKRLTYFENKYPKYCFSTVG